MSPSRTLLAAAIALAVAACTDTPTATESVDDLAFAKPASSGVVERSTSFGFLVIVDTDNGLMATVGFDRVQYCADGNTFPDPAGAEYRVEHDVQRTFHAKGQVTDVRVWEGPLVVYDYNDVSVRRCDRPLVGSGTGHTRFRFIGPAAGFGVGRDITLNNFNGFITAIADGSRKRVNVVITHLDGVRMNPSAGFHEINAKIIVR